ncbi:putative multisensor signal transduction histidine kinase [Trichinella spiralis]|uniref:putative multisensor signal transduction histidine kinase n=1 Tax=Trichinella spiralis TaxID=6334 RepID=UPI0001EFCC77|nr:putative multisensor signal transduction histidine kinase [Trichinella spiralis]
MDQVIKSAQDAAGTLERKLLQEFLSREAIEKYRGELVRLLCQGDKLKTLRHGTHSLVEWEQCTNLMREQVGAAGEWLRQKCQVSTEFLGGHSDSTSAVAGSFDGLSGATESSESCLLEADAGVQSTRTWMWTQSCLLILMQMTAPLIMISCDGEGKFSQATGSRGIEDHSANLPRRSEQCIC